MFKFVDIIGTDEESKTVLASYRDGSIVLDAIPATVNYMKNKVGYTMLFKDNAGVVIEVTPESTIDSVEADWLAAKDREKQVFLAAAAQKTQAQPTL